MPRPELHMNILHTFNLGHVSTRSRFTNRFLNLERVFRIKRYKTVMKQLDCWTALVKYCRLHQNEDVVLFEIKMSLFLIRCFCFSFWGSIHLLSF